MTNSQESAIDPSTVRYQVGMTPNGHGYLHWTSDGKLSLCNRSMVNVRESNEQDEKIICGLCRKSKKAGHNSPTKPRLPDYSRPRRARPTATARTPLEQKAGELEALATEIRELREQLKQKIQCFDQLKRDFAKFLDSVDISND